jgi:predicted DNA-binding protein with PD1-like motif
MNYSEAKQGRVFVLRLEDGDVIHETIERFAAAQAIRAAALIILGGADTGSTLVVGPEDGHASPVRPMEQLLDGAHEIAGTGTLFLNESGKPVLHMHVACGRKSSTVTGCVRKGVKTWLVLEVILFELTATAAMRRKDPATGLELLHP